jgi:zinc protease
VLSKSFQLANYSVLAGDPGFVTEDLRRLRAVTADDVMRVYREYVAERPHIATSFVPQGRVELALDGSEPADIVEEAILADGESTPPGDTAPAFEKTPSRIDRSMPPALAQRPELRVPDVWSTELANGVRVLGIEHRELPLVQFSIRLDGGRRLDDPARPGVANLVSDMLMEGTRERTPAELEVAIDTLGATITVRASNEAITLGATTLARNYRETLALAEEILLEPRWDAEAFELTRERTLSQIHQQEGSPTAIAGAVLNRLVYGPEHVLAHNPLGTAASVSTLALNDLRAFYDAGFSPSVTTMHVAGDIGQDEVMASLAGLESRWTATDVQWPEYELPAAPTAAQLYFVDVPNAPQSVISVGQMAMARTNPEYYPATVMNHRLGGGITSLLFQRLRLERGYSYGASSGFRGQQLPGLFVANTSVRANVTYESVELIRDILTGYADGYTAGDLDASREELVRGNLRAFETLGALLNMVQNISAYDLPADYIGRQATTAAGLTTDDMRALARTHVNHDRMVYVVVGDARTQLDRLGALGLGSPIVVDRDARPIETN